MNTTSPFRALREATGLSKTQFVHASMLSYSTVVFVEAGLYVNERANSALLKLCAEKGIDVNGILEEYGGGTIESATVLWQRQMRQAASARIDEGWDKITAAPDDHYSPFEDFARASFGSKDAFCKSLKVPVAVAYQFDVGVVKSQMPAILREALMDAGLSDQRINQLVSEQQAWLHEEPALAHVD